MIKCIKELSQRTYFQQRLARKIFKNTGIKVAENSFIRTYAGKHMKSSGAFLWHFSLEHPRIGIVGSCFTATECLRKDCVLIVQEQGFCEYEIFPEFM